MKIRRLAFSVCAFLAMPLLVPAQETKLVNCRSLEAAGNFVGPDEVIDGDRVCKKAKPGDVSTAKPEPEKPVPAASAIPSVEPVSVAEAARANAAAKAAAKKAMAKDPEPAKAAEKAESPAAETVKVATPVPAAAAQVSNAPASAPPVSAAPTPSTTSVAVPASRQPASPSTDEPGPAFTSANAPVVKAERVAAPLSAPASAAVAGSSSAAAATPAPPVRVHRDAPVAPGTPSEPPEIDHGFSDANAVEVPAAAKNGAAPARTAESSERKVQLGGLDNLDGKSSASQRAQPACAKNITLGSLRDGQLSLAAPDWAEKWIANNQTRLANICFSPTPRAGARNYLIVFYVAPNVQSGGSAAMPLPDASGGAGDFTTKDGSTWHYSAEHVDSRTAAPSGGGAVTQVWYATAYTETGAPVAERWPDSSKHGDEQRASEDLLNAVVEDLRKL